MAHVESTCSFCRRPFRVHPSEIARGNGRYCSHRCAARAQSGPRWPIAERFWSKVARGEPTACWPWIGGRFPQGYGQFGIDGKNCRSNRVAWELTHGPIPNGLWVCHRCDNPPCCNPAHLFLGTLQENVADMVTKGRHVGGSGRPFPHIHPDRRARGDRNGSRTKPESRPRGERFASAKLTDAAVRAIRSAFATGGITQKQLAAQYAVSDTLIGAVVARRNWKHVE